MSNTKLLMKAMAEAFKDEPTKKSVTKKKQTRKKNKVLVPEIKENTNNETNGEQLMSKKTYEDHIISWKENNKKCITEGDQTKSFAEYLSNRVFMNTISKNDEKKYLKRYKETDHINEWRQLNEQRSDENQKHLPFDEYIIEILNLNEDEAFELICKHANEQENRVEDYSEYEETTNNKSTTSNDFETAKKEFRNFVQEHFCYIKDNVLVLSAETNQWTAYKRTDAEHMLWQDYYDVAKAFQMACSEEILRMEQEGENNTKNAKDDPDDELEQRTRDSMARASVSDTFKHSILLKPSLVWYPGKNLYCNYNGSPRLNTFVDNREVGVYGEDDLDEEALADVTGLFAQLGGCDPADGMTLISDGKSAPAWIAQWLAHAWRTPEERINTMLWLVSKSKGIGKGLLWRMIEETFGAALTSIITQDEMDSDKNGSMSETLFLNYDEADAFKKKNISKTFYRILGNPHVVIRKLYMDAYRSPNRLRILGTTNELTPIWLEKDCRRHTIIRSREGLEAKSYVSDLWNRINFDRDDTKEYSDRFLIAFIMLMETIEIDYNFINRPLENDHRTMLMNMSTPLIERWFIIKSKTWQVGDFLPVTQLWNNFHKFCQENNESKDISRKWFDNNIGIVLEDWIIKPQNESGRYKQQRGYFKIKDHPDGQYIEVSDQITNIKNHQRKLKNKTQEEITDELSGSSD